MSYDLQAVTIVMNCQKIVQFVTAKLISNAQTTDAFQSECIDFIRIILNIIKWIFFWIYFRQWTCDFSDDCGFVSIQFLFCQEKINFRHFYSCKFRIWLLLVMEAMKLKLNAKENTANVLNQNSVVLMANVYHPDGDAITKMVQFNEFFWIILMNDVF